jgi:multidrug transporter EmrE-like cation transporter
MSATGLLLVLVTAALTTAANLLLRGGIDASGGFAIGSMTATLQALVKLFMQPRFSAGFVLYFLASVVWFRVVATEPLSMAYPILVSCTFTLVTAGAVVMFKEPLTARQVLGLAVIVTGIALISIARGPRA